MMAKYKKLFLWSSLGSIAIGAAVSLARRTGRQESRPVSCRRIPPGCRGVDLWTERFESEEGGTLRMAHDRYYLLPTSFKVWSVLDLERPETPEKPLSGGADIYHVTRVRVLEDGEEQERVEERFYGVVTVVDAAGAPCGSGHIGRGGTLEIRKCYVGGASNGVESGEVHRSSAPILNYRIDHESY